ncbi:MAG: single-stranded DNA-binding protein [Candidatus Thermoplasmatota archaeon]|nr:single-stranded DNA-binding protein [Candidatus Thermoplasmatota archaeon]
MEEKNLVKVDELTPASKNADVTVKVLNLSERKTIDSKFGGSRDLVEATVGDETGTVILTLWGEQIDAAAQDDVLEITNGYVSLVRGHMRLNVGKYGAFKKVDEEIPEVKTSVDKSADEYEQERRPSRGGGSYGGGGGGGRGRPRGNQPSRSRGRRRY